MNSAVLAFLFISGALGAQSPDIRVDVDLVPVACSVTDHQGVPVKGLKREDFTLLDDGTPREIRNLWQESDLPLTVALVADVSASQSSFISSHREVLTQFLHQVIGRRDKAMIVEIAHQARVICDLTGNPDYLNAAVDDMGTREGRTAPMLGPPCRNTGFPRSCGGTALWHGLYFVAKYLKPIPGRKAIIVLSDGMDTGSDVSVNNLIEMTQSAGTVIYSIKYPNPMRFISITGAIAQAVSHGLERISRETGGLTFSNPGRKTSEVFTQIENDLRNMYVLGFTPATGEQDGKFHKLEVKTVRPELTVRSRAGYIAPSKDQQ